MCFDWTTARRDTAGGSDRLAASCSVTGFGGEACQVCWRGSQVRQAAFR